MIYLIRHAPTASNLNGIMVKNYSAQNILPFDKDIIENNIPTSVDKVYTSKAIRAKQTADVLYPEAEQKTLECLNEFECHGIGERKFWEMNEDEFNSMVSEKVNPEIMLDSMLDMWQTLTKISEDTGDIVCISHGLKIRTFIHFLKCMKSGSVKSEDFNPYRLINSMDEKFCNLDVLKVSSDFEYEIIESGIKTHGFAEKVN